VHGHLYGTSAAQVHEAMDAGTDLLFDIDFQGGRQLKRRFPDEVVLVFILPPSVAELERRLRQRGLDAPEAIDRRLRVAREEMRHYDEYDYVIVNGELDRAYDALRAVYMAELHLADRQRDAARVVLESASEEG
jgi:guanylate kinase